VTNVDRMTASGMTASAMMVGAWAEQNRCLVVILAVDTDRFAERNHCVVEDLEQKPD